MRWVIGMLSSCLFGVSWAISRLSHFWICCGCSSASVSACVEEPSTGTCDGVMPCSRWTVTAGSTLSTMNGRLRPELVSTTTVNGTSVHDQPVALSLTFFFIEGRYNDLIFRAIQANGEDFLSCKSIFFICYYHIQMIQFLVGTYDLWGIWFFVKCKAGDIMLCICQLQWELYDKLISVYVLATASNILIIECSVFKKQNKKTRVNSSYWKWY